MDRFYFYRRRLLVLGGIKVAILSFIIQRLFVLQKFKKTFYQNLADRNRKVALPIQPMRGKILDRRGEVLAGSKETYQMFLNVIDESQSNQIIYEVEKILSLDLSNIKLFGLNRSILLKDHLTFEEFSKIELHKCNLPGIFLEKNQNRNYFYNTEISHVLGFIGMDSTQKSDRKVGKSGLEKSFDERLSGVQGVKLIEVDAKRKQKRILSVTESNPGHSLPITIDMRLQKKVIEIFEEVEKGSCIVMNPKSGEIYAYYSKPSFDLQVFTKSVSKKEIKQVLEDPRKPLLDKNLQGLYPPASLFKMIVGIAALSDQVISEKTQFLCKGSIQVGKQKFHCWNWKNGGHGYLNLQRAIACSCDVFFYQLVLSMGISKIIEIASLFGFGNITGIDLPGEKRGLLPTKEWKKKHKKQSWTIGDSVNMSIGQGFLLVTPLQITKMMCMLVNGGFSVTPHFYSSEQNIIFKKVPILESHQKIILKSMNSVVNDEFGTAFKSRLKNPFSMGGKTASSQVSRITMKQRELGTVNKRESRLKEHSMFSGYGNVDDPNFVVTVIVENGGGGAAVAAPISSKIIKSSLEILSS